MPAPVTHSNPETILKNQRDPFFSTRRKLLPEQDPAMTEAVCRRSNALSLQDKRDEAVAVEEEHNRLLPASATHPATTVTARSTRP